jgi:uncharacterized damage-inducible protein DinB
MKGMNMNTQNIHIMYNYNYWASGKILEAAAKITEEQFLAPAEFPYGGLRGTLFHIVDGERLWRVLFETNKVVEEWQEEDFPTFKSLEVKFHEEERALKAYLNGLTDEDLEGHLRYTVEGGIQRDRILWHCLYHLVNHGTQHRSEAAAMLTSFNASPGDLDFTVFLNETKP